MPSPFTHAFLPAGCAILCLREKLKRRKDWFLFFIICTFLGNSPDWDLFPAILLGVDDGTIHRAWGHNVFSLMACSALGAYLLRRFVLTDTPLWPRLTLSFALVASHLVLDAMNDLHPQWRYRPGVPLFWPFSKHEFLLPCTTFPIANVETKTIPYLPILISREFWTHMVVAEIRFMAVAFGIWWLSLIAYRWVARRLSGRKSTRNAYRASRSGRQSDPEPPSPHRPDGSPIRKDKGSLRAF